MWKNPMKNKILPRLSLPFVVFGFMLIIATGFNMILGDDTIPIIVSIIGLVFIIIGMTLRKRNQ